MKNARYRVYLLQLLLPLLVLSCPAAFAAEGKESLVKGAFIYNFVKFVEWPGDKAVGKLSSIDICTLGDDDLASAAKVFKAASTDKLKLNLLSESGAKSAAGHCHIVFISSSESGKLSQILADLKSHPVLLVSDSDNFVEQGGMIGFVVNDNKIKIAVNTKAVSASGLRVDAQLLEIALKVIDK